MYPNLPLMEMKEEFLQFIWQCRLFRLPLADLDEQPVSLLDPGIRNHDAGPDFLCSRIQTGNILWAGNVEIHRKASEWYLHNHHLDPAYDNVILHVVMEADCQVQNSKGRLIRTAKMEIEPAIFRQYRLLMGSPDFIPCRGNIQLINPQKINIWLERMMVERAEARTTRILADFKSSGGNWEDTVYITIARAFGQVVNAQPFEMLARSVPYRTLRKHCPDLPATEALLFGQAGMLELPGRLGTNQAGMLDPPGRLGTNQAGMFQRRDLTGPPGFGPRSDTRSSGACSDPYFLELSERYQHLRKTLCLKPLDAYLWKYLRLRPDNFPTIRIAQLASSLVNCDHLYRGLQYQSDPMKLIESLDISASQYWTTHYRFGLCSPERVKSMGTSRLNGLMLNALIPLMIAGRQPGGGNRVRGLLRWILPGSSQISTELLKVLREIPAENNRIIRMWQSLGMEVPDAFSSQALIQMTNKYCKFKRCLSCYVGSQIIQSFRTEDQE